MAKYQELHKKSTGNASCNAGDEVLSAHSKHMGNVSRDALGTMEKSIKLSIEGKTKPMDCIRNARSSTKSAKDARGLLHSGMLPSQGNVVAISQVALCFFHVPFSGSDEGGISCLAEYPVDRAMRFKFRFTV